LASLRDKHILTQRRKENHKTNTVAVLIFSTRTAGVERLGAMHLSLFENHFPDSSALSNDWWMAPVFSSSTKHLPGKSVSLWEKQCRSAT
jgi:hypothetical protein